MRPSQPADHDELLLEELECAEASDYSVTELPSARSWTRPSLLDRLNSTRRLPPTRLILLSALVVAAVVLGAVVSVQRGSVASSGAARHSIEFVDAEASNDNASNDNASNNNASDDKASDDKVSDDKASDDKSSHDKSSHDKSSHDKVASADDARERDERKRNEREKEEEEGCASPGAGCLKSKCCKEAGHQCYTKNDYWAQCMVKCTPGPNPEDQVSPMPWECKALGNRTDGEPSTCSSDSEDCSKTKCCLTGGMTCFEKNENYARCKPSCTPGPDLADENSDPWSCKALGPQTVGAAPWVKTKCATGGVDCTAQACCAEPGFQCYRQSDYYAQCKPSCTPGEKLHPWDKPWSCETVGSKTPAFVAGGAETKKGLVGEWVPETCNSPGEDCSESKCCKAVGTQCYSKSEFWASCKYTCSTAPDPNDDNATWSCKELGPQSWGLATQGWPSLYCFSVMRTTGYEPNLMKAQLNASAGIFKCDGYDLLADGVTSIGFPPGKTDDKDEVVTIAATKGISVGISQDGTAANAKLFMAAWDTIIANGRFRNYDWTIKVDPDAVLLPWRLRDHMRAHTGEKVYVVNCNKFPTSPNFPMMYGALEVFSSLAMDAYAMSSWKCGKELPWKAWGEDYYMTHCMDYIGVGRIGDFAVLGDNTCTGANCLDAFVASYHPFKDIGSWFQCWGQATQGR